MKRAIYITIIVLVISIGVFLFGSKKGIKNEEKESPVQETTPAQEPPPEIEIPEDMQRKIGVRAEEAKVEQVIKTIRTVGRIEPDERRSMVVSTKFEGWVERLYANYTGASVRKGEPILEIYSPEVLATEEEFLIAKRLAEADDNSKVLLEGARRRLRLWGIPEDEIQRLQDTGTASRTITLRSPASGYVIEKMVLEGSRIMPGERILTISDLSNVWVIADVYEYEAGLLRVGQRAEIALSYMPGVRLSSRIDYIYPTVSMDTRTLKVRFDLPNPDLKLKPGMFTDIEIKVNLGRRLMIPEDSVIDTGERQIVYVERADGYFEPREVRTGIREAAKREVISGLRAGERVASSATFLLDSEAQFRGIKPLPLKESD